MAAKKHSPAEIEKLYESGDFHVVQERNDFLLPQIRDFVQKDRWINTKPEYQRRLVWDKKKKSRLIESLLMNIPVPPVFLFEQDLSRYEVMDGQQRLNSILEFYANELKLTGLEHWKILNGCRYGDLPPLIQRGLDRRRISATVLLHESGGTRERAKELRRQIFDRLNTGGQKLNAQELRNCLFSGDFNTSLVTLAANPQFNDMFEVPRYQDHIRRGVASLELRDNALYRRMRDVEIVLRFLTFRGPKSKIVGAVKTMLDRKMEEGEGYSAERVQAEREAFTSTIDTAWKALGRNAFKWPEGKGKYGAVSIPLYDAVMVAFDRLREKRSAILRNKAAVRRAIDATVTKGKDAKELFTGKANTAQSIRDRLDMMERAVKQALH